VTAALKLVLRDDLGDDEREKDRQAEAGEL
jgi:hypothetical protein